MKKKPTKTKRKNVDDLTLRNLRALKKRIEQASWSFDNLPQWITALTLDVHLLDLWVKKLEEEKKNEMDN